MSEEQQQATKRTVVFWGLSIDEAKVSVLVILCLVVFLFALGVYVARGDISDNLTLLIQTLIVTIGGINISNMITNVISPPPPKKHF